MYEDSAVTDASAVALQAEPSTAQAIGARPGDVSLFHRRGRQAIRTFVLAIALLVVGVVFGALGLKYLAGLVFLTASVMSVFACARAVRAMLVVGQVKPMPLGFAGAVALFPMLGGLFMAAVGALFAFLSTATFTRGRQLRAFGRVLLPEVRPGAAWLNPPTRPIDQVSDARGVAKAWRENGRTEHASVAAFANLTLDLLALGAPEALIRAAQQDALDEIRHTRACFSLARDLDGEDQSPGPFPQPQGWSFGTRFRRIKLARLAVESLIDGALHEGLSAAVMAKLATRTTIPAIASTLLGLAADEGRHAAHGWDAVEWCLQEGGPAVAAALRGAMLALPEEMPAENEPAAATSGDWETFGIAGRRLKESEYAKARAGLARRLGTLLGAASEAPV